MEVNGQFHALGKLPKERVPCTHCIGGWVDLRVGLDALDKRKSSCPSSTEPDSSVAWSPYYDIPFITCVMKKHC